MTFKHLNNTICTCDATTLHLLMHTSYYETLLYQMTDVPLVVLPLSIAVLYTC